MTDPFPKTDTPWKHEERGRKSERHGQQQAVAEQPPDRSPLRHIQPSLSPVRQIKSPNGAELRRSTRQSGAKNEASANEAAAAKDVEVVTLDDDEQVEQQTLRRSPRKSLFGSKEGQSKQEMNKPQVQSNLNGWLKRQSNQSDVAEIDTSLSKKDDSPTKFWRSPRKKQEKVDDEKPTDTVITRLEQSMSELLRSPRNLTEAVPETVHQLQEEMLPELRRSPRKPYQSKNGASVENEVEILDSSTAGLRRTPRKAKESGEPSTPTEPQSERVSKRRRSAPHASQEKDTPEPPTKQTKPQVDPSSPSSPEIVYELRRTPRKVAPESARQVIPQSQGGSVLADNNEMRRSTRNPRNDGNHAQGGDQEKTSPILFDLRKILIKSALFHDEMEKFKESGEEGLFLPQSLPDISKISFKDIFGVDDIPDPSSSSATAEGSSSSSSTTKEPTSKNVARGLNSLIKRPVLQYRVGQNITLAIVKKDFRAMIDFREEISIKQFLYSLLSLDVKPTNGKNHVHRFVSDDDKDFCLDALQKARKTALVRHVKGTLIHKDISNGSEKTPVKVYDNTGTKDGIVHSEYEYIIRNDTTGVQPTAPDGAFHLKCGCTDGCGMDCPCVHKSIRNGQTFIAMKQYIVTNENTDCWGSACFACGPACGCKGNCSNAAPHSATNSKLELFRRNKLLGMGVRTTKSVLPGEILFEFTGELTKDVDTCNKAYAWALYEPDELDRDGYLNTVSKVFDYKKQTRQKPKREKDKASADKKEPAEERTKQTKELDTQKEKIVRGYFVGFADDPDVKKKQEMEEKKKKEAEEKKKAENEAKENEAAKTGVRPSTTVPQGTASNGSRKEGASSAPPAAHALGIRKSKRVHLKVSEGEKTEEEQKEVKTKGSQAVSDANTETVKKPRKNIKLPMPEMGYDTIYIDPYKKGNIGRFVSHAEFPNATPIRLFENDLRIEAGRLMFIASRAIPAGGEIFVDYGSGYQGFDECLCGSIGCSDAEQIIKSSGEKHAVLILRKHLEDCRAAFPKKDPLPEVEIPESAGKDLQMKCVALNQFEKTGKDPAYKQLKKTFESIGPNSFGNNDEESGEDTDDEMEIIELNGGDAETDDE